MDVFKQFSIKEQDLLKENWNVLIILDACRYDFFQANYREYLDGKLEKRRSKGVPFWGWNAVEHFHKIIDVWKSRWDENKGTVYPEKVNEAALDALSENDGKRVIVHYLQPHTPYLTGDSSSKHWEQLEKIRGGIETDRALLNRLNALIKSIFGENVESKLGELAGAILRVIGMDTVWKFREKLERDPIHPSEIFWRKFHDNIERLCSLYEDNLRLVLKSISKLIYKVEGKVIVTADHGEAFGEQHVWEHYPNIHIPVLVEVPWLEIES